MTKLTLVTLILSLLILSACGGNTPTETPNTATPDRVCMDYSICKTYCLQSFMTCDKAAGSSADQHFSCQEHKDACLVGKY